MRHYPALPARARGAVLIVGLIVLMLITLMVSAAYKFSTFNLKSVGNMQSRNEAIAVANKALEQMVTSRNFDVAQVGETLDNVDVDNTGNKEFLVTIDAPTCIKATRIMAGGEAGSSPKDLESGTQILPSTANTIILYSVIFDIKATATHALSGSRVAVHQGISKTLSETQCAAACAATGAVCS